MDDAEYNRLIAYVAWHSGIPERFLRGDVEMSDEKHTKEPWRDGDQNGMMPEGHIIDLNGRLIAGCMGHVAPQSGDVNRANARRIVAAVNAVAGIPTHELEEFAAHKSNWCRLETLADAALFYANKGDTK